jgi:hypothetical protein
MVLPEEASTGETPLSAAKAASECSRSGLSPAASSSALALSAPTPNSASSGAACVATSWLIWVCRAVARR